MAIFRIVNFHIFLVVISLLLVSCSVPFINKSTIINVHIAASDYLNPDGDGRPSPLVVRVYELKTTGIFDAADYFALFNDDTTLLAADITHREEFNLKPGEQKSYKRKPAEDAKYLAVMAAYRNSNQAIWKHTKEIPAKKKTDFQIILGALNVSILSNR